MRTISSISEFREFRNKLSGTIGFVPTMGALHEGHLSLVKKSNKTCDYTIVSIFVNHLQFAEDEDLKSYPRTLKNDLHELEVLSVEVVFLPTKDLMYPVEYSTYINEGVLSTGLEGKSRPAFFRGVATIVAKLFNIVNPTHTFFGEKDAQQLRVIQKMVHDLNFSIDVVSCPIIREKNGLAMSSRNKHLSSNTRERASIIYSGLKHGKLLLDNGERNANIIRSAIAKFIQQESLAKIDYVSISNNHSLKEIVEDIEGCILISTAVYFGNIRLIDNITFHLE